MWILIWVILSLFVLGVTAWSYIILYEQKKSWQAFAKKRNLTYNAGSFLGPPLVRGAIGDVNIALFTGQQQTDDARGQRLVTAIEVDLQCGLPTAAAIGTAETGSFINALRLDYRYQPDAPPELWDDSYLLRTRDPVKLKNYLTAERLAALKNIFSMKNSVALLFFDEIDCVLRIETQDPLRDSEKMEKIIMRILREAKKMRPTEEEKTLAVEERKIRAALQAEQEAVMRAAERVAEKALASAPTTVAAPEGPAPLLQGDKEPK